MEQDVKAQHTPGPWATSAIAEGTLVEVQSADGELDIAACYFGDPVSEPYSPRHTEACANARLIAASPELLEALKDFLEMREAHLQGNVHPKGEFQIVAQARAAIAKATGEQP